MPAAARLRWFAARGLSPHKIFVRNTFLHVALETDAGHRRSRSCPPATTRAVDLDSARATAASAVPALQLFPKTGELQQNDILHEGRADCGCEIGPSATDGETTDAGTDHGFERSGSDSEDGKVRPSHGGSRMGESDPIDWSCVTVVMIRNLPCRCKHVEVFEAINDVGFAHEVDSFYMPFRRAPRQNLGYAFVGFSSPSVCSRFREAISGYKFKTRRSSKSIDVRPASRAAVCGSATLGNAQAVDAS